MAPALPDMSPLWWPSVLLLLLLLYEGAVSFLVDWVESFDFLLLIAFQWGITCASTVLTIGWLLQLITEGFCICGWFRGSVDPAADCSLCACSAFELMVLPLAAPCGVLAMGPTAHGVVGSWRSSRFDCFQALLALLDWWVLLV